MAVWKVTSCYKSRWQTLLCGGLPRGVTGQQQAETRATRQVRGRGRHTGYQKAAEGPEEKGGQDTYILFSNTAAETRLCSAVSPQSASLHTLC